MNLESLYQLGYEYYLWKVNSQDGSKEVVASSNAMIDYSHAAKTEFYLPSPVESEYHAHRRLDTPEKTDPVCGRKHTSVASPFVTFCPFNRAGKTISV